MKRKLVALRSVQKSYQVIGYSGLVMGLGLCSYPVRELLVCWLFFSLPFVMMGLLVLGVVIACDAGLYIIQWAGSAARVLPVTVVVGEVKLKPAPDSGAKLTETCGDACAHRLTPLVGAGR